MILALLIVCVIGWGLSKRNPYIDKHNFKIDNDKKYIDYLSWCAYFGYIPMDKKEFIAEIEAKEKELQNLINKKSPPTKAGI